MDGRRPEAREDLGEQNPAYSPTRLPSGLWSVLMIWSGFPVIWGCFRKQWASVTRTATAPESRRPAASAEDMGDATGASLSSMLSMRPQAVR